jgi:hypothetical protein
MIKGSSTDKMKGKSETIQLLLPKAKGSAFGPASPDDMCYFCILCCLKKQSFTGKLKTKVELHVALYLQALRFSIFIFLKKFKIIF